MNDPTAPAAPAVSVVVPVRNKPGSVAVVTHDRRRARQAPQLRGDLARIVGGTRAGYGGGAWPEQT